MSRRDDAILLRVLQRLQAALDLGFGVFLVRFLAPADEDLVSVVAVVVIEPDIRDGCAMVTGRICVIGSRLNEMAVAELFGTAE